LLFFGRLLFALVGVTIVIVSDGGFVAAPRSSVGLKSAVGRRGSFQFCDSVFADLVEVR
jgi:hypothetical protein